MKPVTFNYERYEEALAEIERLTAENKRLCEVSRWIPVSERLPVRYEPVLVYSQLWIRPVLALIRDDDEFWTGEEAVTPAYWMPLPELPEGE